MIAFSQVDDGVVALNIPARNSLMFNRFVTQPTFSFVREQNKYITVTNKRELVGVEDAPLTYLVNYSGRIKENIGAGIGVYQQNYGVLTNFGGILNFAYNIRAQEDSNFTFGLNIGAYKSGLNNGRVVTNVDDPALNNIPSNFLLTVNPGLNYGTGFMDFGVSLNNIVTYNFNASGLVEDNPMQGIQGHIMYTGYFEGYGFFQDSRFSALARSEFQKDATIVSGVVMLTVPKGIWAQVGYNTMYGATGGLGVNLTKQLAVEYNYVRQFVGLTNFGASHEITLAYKFENLNYYDYSRDDDLASLFTSGKKRTPKKRITKVPNTPSANEPSKLEEDEEVKLAVEERKKVAADEQAQEETAKQAMADAEKKARLVAEEQTRLEEERMTQQRLNNSKANDIRESMSQLVTQTETSSNQRTQLLNELEAALARKEKGLDALRENDGLIDPEALQNLQNENEKIELLKIDLDTIFLRNKKKMLALESLLQDRVAISDPNDEINKEYKKLIVTLKAEQEEAVKSREALDGSLEQMAIAIERLASEKRRDEEEELAEAPEKSNERESLSKIPTDEIGKSLSDLVSQTEASNITRAQLLKDLERAVAIKEKDLKDLKEENDLSEQNIYVAPKPFKSISKENEQIELLRINLDTVILRNKKKILRLEALLQDRVDSFNDPNDETNLYYQNVIATLKADQEKSIRNRASLVSSLEQINIATGIERKRRIKRAAYVNDQDRYTQDRKMLASLKENVSISDAPLTYEATDFGRQRSNNIQILKNVDHAESGYYLVLAVHNDVTKRDEFLVKVMSSGNKEVDFFFDVNTSEYYIYSRKFNTINEAERALGTKSDAPYNKNISLIKIEN